MLELARNTTLETASVSFLSALDRAILETARTLLPASTPRTRDGDAVIATALQRAVEEHIPAGRVYLLGWERDAPVLGSLISNVGVVRRGEALFIVRYAAGSELHQTIGALW